MAASKGINWDNVLPEVLGDIDAGLSLTTIAKKLGVHRKTLSAAIARRMDGPVKKAKKYEARFPEYKWPEHVDWREYFGSWEEILDQHKRADPFVEHFTIDFTKVDRPIAVVSASDLHLGGGFTDHAAIKTTIEYILDTDDLYLALTGDTIEGFIPGVKPAETVEQQVSSVKSQLSAMESMVDELCAAEKLLWLGWGDHDAKWFEQTIGLNVVKQMHHNKVPYLQGRAVIRLLVGGEEYFVLANHAERSKSKWSASHAGRVAYESFFPADVVISGHTHKPEFRRFEHYQELRSAGLNLGGKSWIVQNGTFKTGPDPYTIRTWNRGVLGVPTIVFQPNEHDVDVFDTPEKAMQFIRGGE
jgi:hypothetical protein